MNDSTSTLTVAPTRIDDFGELPDGTPVPRFRLTSGALTMEVIALGGIVTRLSVPDRSGTAANVLLSPATVEQILGRSPYLGALVGRVANRIGGASFTLDGRTYPLAANDGTATLHGGRVGYDKRLWAAEPFAAPDGPALRLTLVDPDGTEGFPGTVRVEVIYTLTPGAWRIDYTATTDAPTPINLTQHSYFNLRDAGRSTILDHVVRLHASTTTPPGADLVPTGAIVALAGTPLDYRTARPAGQAFGRLTNTPRGVDDNFVLDAAPDADGLRPAADVVDPVSGRTLAVHTDAPAIQFYTGNFLDGTHVGPDGFAYAQHTGFCLETQGYPNSVNVPGFPSVILRPGETYRTRTEYRFATQ